MVEIIVTNPGECPECCVPDGFDECGCLDLPDSVTCAISGGVDSGAETCCDEANGSYVLDEDFASSSDCVYKKTAAWSCPPISRTLRVTVERLLGSNLLQIGINISGIGSWSKTFNDGGVYNDSYCFGTFNLGPADIVSVSGCSTGYSFVVTV